MASIANRFRRAVLTRLAAFRTKRLIVFLTPGYEHRTGGVLSIAAMYRESLALRHLHRGKVVICGVPGDDPLYFKYTWFRNRNYLLDLNSVLRNCAHLDFLLLHIPEYAINQVLEWLNSAAAAALLRVREVHLNILLQNLDCLQGQNVSELRRFGTVTCTTAHEAYSSSATRDLLGVSVHRLGVCIGPESYSKSSFHDKEALLVVSNDPHPMREQVLNRIVEACPHLSIQVIQNLSYEAYKKLIFRAKWSLTFGEGLDGYFAEPVWSGGIAFAVFNDRYFTPAFAALETVYPNWEILANELPADLLCLDDPVSYNRCWQQAYDLLNELYGVDRFRENLRLFYRGEYTFPWDPGSANKGELVAGDGRDGQRLSAAPAVSSRIRKSKSVKAMLVTHHLPEESMPWMAEVRAVFDELVIFIDENRVQPGAVDRAKEVGSRVHLYKADKWYDWDLGAKARACDSDWVLQIEYDEELSPEWQQSGWRSLLEKTERTHFWIPRRWIVPFNQYIDVDPWRPDFQLRLFRNNLKGATFPTRLHDTIHMPGPGASFKHLAIHHHALSLCSRDARVERARHYEQLRPGGALGYYYLYEDHTLYGDHTPHLALLPKPVVLDVSREAISMEKLLAEETSKISVEVSNVPREVNASAMFWLRARIINSLNQALYAAAPHPVRLAYHWLERSTREMVVFEGIRSGLFPGLDANATGQCYMTILAPEDPGEYILQTTMVQEGVFWFENIRPDIIQEFGVSVRATTSRKS